jgi:hypothetical protein
MTENSKEIQTLDQGQTPVNARRQWTRPEVHSSKVRDSELGASSHADGPGDS